MLFNRIAGYQDSVVEPIFLEMQSILVLSHIYIWNYASQNTRAIIIYIAETIVLLCHDKVYDMHLDGLVSCCRFTRIEDQTTNTLKVQVSWQLTEQIC